eukprot:jgi/Mesen1/9062/ME000574S08452
MPLSHSIGCFRFGGGKKKIAYRPRPESVSLPQLQKELGALLKERNDYKEEVEALRTRLLPTTSGNLDSALVQAPPVPAAAASAAVAASSALSEALQRENQQLGAQLHVLRGELRECQARLWASEQSNDGQRQLAASALEELELALEEAGRLKGQLRALSGRGAGGGGRLAGVRDKDEGREVRTLGNNSDDKGEGDLGGGTGGRGVGEGGGEGEGGGGAQAVAFAMSSTKGKFDGGLGEREVADEQVTEHEAAGGQLAERQRRFEAVQAELESKRRELLECQVECVAGRQAGAQLQQRLDVTSAELESKRRVVLEHGVQLSDALAELAACRGAFAGVSTELEARKRELLECQVELSRREAEVAVYQTRCNGANAELEAKRHETLELHLALSQAAAQAAGAAVNQSRADTSARAELELQQRDARAAGGTLGGSLEGFAGAAGGLVSNEAVGAAAAGGGALEQMPAGARGLAERAAAQAAPKTALEAALPAGADVNDRLSLAPNAAKGAAATAAAAASASQASPAPGDAKDGNAEAKLRAAELALDDMWRQNAALKEDADAQRARTEASAGALESTRRKALECQVALAGAREETAACKQRFAAVCAELEGKRRALLECQVEISGMRADANERWKKGDGSSVAGGELEGKRRELLECQVELGRAFTLLSQRQKKHAAVFAELETKRRELLEHQVQLASRQGATWQASSSPRGLAALPAPLGTIGGEGGDVTRGEQEGQSPASDLYGMRGELEGKRRHLLEAQCGGETRQPGLE